MITSTSSFGPPGLDLRPAPPHGSSVDLWVMDCPLCGYCAPDLDKPIDLGNDWQSLGGALNDSLDRHGAWRLVVRELMASTRYLTPFDIKDAIPKQAIAHLRCGVMQHAGGHPAEAGHSALCAAWLCDDNAPTLTDGQLGDGAAQCRRAALGLFHQAREADQPFALDRIHEELLLIDLLRRTGDFVLAAERISALPMDIGEEERAIAIRQQGWLALRDRAAHHAEEIPPGPSV